MRFVTLSKILDFRGKVNNKRNGLPPSTHRFPERAKTLVMHATHRPFNLPSSHQISAGDYSSVHQLFAYRLIA